MGRTATPAVDFIDRCIVRANDPKKAYKSFKILTIFKNEVCLPIMTILFPRKKNNFIEEFQEIFKDYENFNNRKYRGYLKKDTIKAAIRKNKRKFEVIFDGHGLLIFCKRMDFSIEKLINKEISASLDREIKSLDRDSRDCHKIENTYERVINVIVGKLCEKLPVNVMQRGYVTLNSDSSGYESYSNSPFSENLNENIDDQIERSSLNLENGENYLPGASVATNSPVYQHPPSASTEGSLVQNSEFIPVEDTEVVEDVNVLIDEKIAECQALDALDYSVLKSYVSARGVIEEFFNEEDCPVQDNHNYPFENGQICVPGASVTTDSLVHQPPPSVSTKESLVQESEFIPFEDMEVEDEFQSCANEYCTKSLVAVENMDYSSVGFELLVEMDTVQKELDPSNVSDSTGHFSDPNYVHHGSNQLLDV